MKKKIKHKKYVKYGALKILEAKKVKNGMRQTRFFSYAVIKRAIIRYFGKLNDIQGGFFNCPPPKKLKYVTPRLGVSTLT